MCLGQIALKSQGAIPERDTIRSVSELRKTLIHISEIPDSTERDTQISQLWHRLGSYNQIPFKANDSVAFLFRGTAKSVKWAGDFNRWSANGSDFEGTPIGGTDIWFLAKKFPADARLDYKISVDGKLIPDPENPFIQYSGFGPNSELRMPAWVFPSETSTVKGITTGSVSGARTIISHEKNLSYAVSYTVYTPYNYGSLSSLPVIYVTDGHEYSDEKQGAMINTLNNLIYEKKIEPVIAVFIDPRQPENPGNNRRMNEYRANARFAGFVADELVPFIDANYKTAPRPEKRAIIGASLGGWNSAYFGLKRSDVFGLLIIHSPSSNQAIIDDFAAAEKLPLRIFMSTGLINDTESQARKLKSVFEAKGYPLVYIEVNEGHSWGNWKALIDKPLIWFFPYHSR